jgi:hypothetical protein
VFVQNSDGRGAPGCVYIGNGGNVTFEAPWVNKMGSGDRVITSNFAGIAVGVSLIGIGDTSISYVVV